VRLNSHLNLASTLSKSEIEYYLKVTLHSSKSEIIMDTWTLSKSGLLIMDINIDSDLLL